MGIDRGRPSLADIFAVEILTVVHWGRARCLADKLFDNGQDEAGGSVVALLSVGRSRDRVAQKHRLGSSSWPIGELDFLGVIQVAIRRANSLPLPTLKRLDGNLGSHELPHLFIDRQ